MTYLSSENYVCEQAFTYGDARIKVNLYDYDCVLLDLMLPDGSGLGIGADDYLPKPFHLAELSMRIYAIIRRKEFAANNLLQSNSLMLRRRRYRPRTTDSGHGYRIYDDLLNTSSKFKPYRNGWFFNDGNLNF